MKRWNNNNYGIFKLKMPFLFLFFLSVCLSVCVSACLSDFLSFFLSFFLYFIFLSSFFCYLFTSVPLEYFSLFSSFGSGPTGT
jgi:hypothetical protein